MLAKRATTKLMTVKIFSAIVAALSACATTSQAQGFSLASEYAKQVKRNPDIRPYMPDVRGVNASFGVEYTPIRNERKLYLDIYSPSERDGEMTPVVFIHGGGWNTGDRKLDMPMAMRLAEAGMCVFCVEYRLSGEAQYPAALKDINTALAWIDAHADSLGVNMSKLTVVGASAGGQMAALLGASNGTVARYLPESGVIPPVINLTVDIDGVLAFIHPDSSEGKDKPGKVSCATQWIGKPMEEDSVRWWDASAVTHVGAWSANRFVFINSSQKRFSAGQADMIELLHKYGKETSEHKTEGTPHTFWLFEPWAEDVAKLIISEVEKKF